MINSKSEVNAIYPTFAKQLGFPIRLTDFRAQKIDSITLDTYRMVVAVFLVKEKDNQVRFFEKTFLIASISPEVVLILPFLTLSGVDVNFQVKSSNRELIPSKRPFRLPNALS